MTPGNEPSSVVAESGDGSQASSHVGSSIAAGALMRSTRIADAGVCVFSIDDRTFGIDTALVGEVTTVDTVVPVPLSPHPVLGVFSLRGTPLAVIDLLLALGQSSQVGHDPLKSYTLLVLRPSQSHLVALRIDRLDAVVPVGRGEKHALTAEAAHPATDGFFEYGAAQPAVMLNSTALLETLLKLSFSNRNTRKEGM